MIKINKCLSPKVLISRGGKLTKKHCDDYDEFSRHYLPEEFKVVFSDVYGDDAVRDALIQCQFNKCCFSEAKFKGEYPPVEHFRPKGRVDIYGTNKRVYPGYYWLAYEWSNLFYCKALINTTYKANFFPLYNESERNLNHHDNNIERSILIDPSVEDPRDYIRFVNDEPVGVDKNGRGDFNIRLLGLTHPVFVQARSEKFLELFLLKTSIDEFFAEGVPINHPAILPLLTLLRNSIKPEAEFSSMAIDFLQGWPHL